MKKLAVYDFDGTLVKSPTPEEGQKIWKEKTGKDFPIKGWWANKESLNLDIFDIEPYPSIIYQLNADMRDEDTHVIILTARIEKLRPEVQKVLDKHNIRVDDLLMKSGNETKGDVILLTSRYNPDLEQIDVYDDMQNKESKLSEYTAIIGKLPKNIEYNISHVNNGTIKLIKSNNNLFDIINEEIKGLINNNIYHGTSEGAVVHILNHGGLKLNAANNNEPFISFTSKPSVASYYATMKGGGDRGKILRTKLTNNFKLSPKYGNNKGHEWITTKEIPVSDLDIQTKSGWMPLENWDIKFK